jgi:hypothetical protein
MLSKFEISQNPQNKVYLKSVKREPICYRRQNDERIEIHKDDNSSLLECSFWGGKLFKITIRISCYVDLFIRTYRK